MAGAFRWPVTVSWGDLRLRPLGRGDRREWDAVRSRNREWLDPWEATNPVPGGGSSSFAHFVRTLDQQARQATALPFVITERAPGTDRFDLIGQLTVSGISWGSFLSATLGYWVDQEQAGRGVAPMAVAMATDYCFQGLGLHRMEINIRPENAASLRVVAKLGLRDEGLRRAYLHVDGAWRDHRTFAVTAEEVPDGLLAGWLATRPRP